MDIFGGLFSDGVVLDSIILTGVSNVLSLTYMNTAENHNITIIYSTVPLL